MDQRTILIIGIILSVAAIICVACVAVGGFGALWFLESGENVIGGSGPTPVSIGPTPELLQTGELPSDETLLVLLNTVVPENDPIELADRLLGIEGIPETVPAPDRFYQVGDRRTFWVTNTDTDETSQKQAVLRYAGDIVYFWVEDGAQYDQAELNALTQTFEIEIVPTNREFFGTEWFPGIDNDPHIYILYSRGVGFNTAGYFSSSDEIHPLAQEYSNAAEMFLINADNSPLNDLYTYGVLAHEFQHMIHWYRDRNETSWLNEGMSELASLLNGYHYGGFARIYTSNPDLQLNDWPNDPNATTPHYGAGLLFVTYFLERFGKEATQALVADPANGLDSVDNVLAVLDLMDSHTNELIQANDVVLDWAIANYLNDASVGDGRYAYTQYPEVISTAFPTETISDCSQANTRDVRQYGVDYININCPGEFTLRFEGSTRTGLLPANPHSGSYAFWSNKGDESDMTLTRSFDFSDVSTPITLSFRTWYDIETDWDYVYLLASTDNGDNWEFLTTPSGTDTNPTGNSYGWGYTGLSGGGETESVWIEERVDLSQFAGQAVLLRFEYVTDAAVNGEGLLVDDISIEETGYFEDFEMGDGGWQAAGFARIQNILPQTFRLALILEGDETTVRYIDVPRGNVVEIPLDLGGEVDEVTLVVVGSTRFTRQPAVYRFSFQQ
jgi:immune inhibitor A